jgi:lipid-A-disaccharide synthase-like uncharacterized protein
MEVDIMEFRVYLRQRAITADLMYTQYSGSYYNFNSSLPVSRSEISCHGLLACTDHHGFIIFFIKSSSSASACAHLVLKRVFISYLNVFGVFILLVYFLFILDDVKSIVKLYCVHVSRRIILEDNKLSLSTNKSHQFYIHVV